jgi:hypothetical protein
MTSCDWNMLAHPALPSFVPGGNRLARLNARLNEAHLLHPKRTLGQAKSNNKYSLELYKAARRRRESRRRLSHMTSQS